MHGLFKTKMFSIEYKFQETFDVILMHLLNFLEISTMKYIEIMSSLFLCISMTNDQSIFRFRLMAKTFDICDHVMVGHAVADDWQEHTRLALLLSQSLYKSKRFDASDVMSRYLNFYHHSKCNIGETTRLVYEELLTNVPATSTTLTRKDFIFTVQQIYDASHSAHKKLNDLSAGCNPVQRSFPLAFCPWIEDQSLFHISCAEARLTHYSPLPGQVAGVMNVICRRLFKGDHWNEAVKAGFSSTLNVLDEIQEIQQRYEHDQFLKSTGHPAYAPNTLHTALHCVARAESFENALELAKKIEPQYCPLLVAVLAGARWIVPQSMLGNCPKDVLSDIHKVAKSFNDEWDKSHGKNKNFFKKIFS